MINFIKKYRNDENRTVLTFKIRECMSANKLGDLNTARRAKNEQNDSKDKENQAQKAKVAGGEQREAHAFKTREHVKWLDDELDSENGCECGCGDRFSMPCGRFEMKGGINCEKTVRVLLCDVVCASAMMVGAMALIKCLGSKLK